eukprot:12269371-Alexandrium_andersonii.AAC.1
MLFGALRPSGPLPAVAIGLGAQNGAERAPRELREPSLGLLPGPRRRSSERLKPCCRFGQLRGQANSAGIV